MRWSRVALYSLAALVAVLAIAISIALTLDFGRFKEDAEVFVSNLLKREFSIDGPLHLTLGRSIKLNAENVRLAGTDWSADPDFASIRKIEASVNTWSLLSWPIMIESLVADGVRVNLEHNALGDNNWTFLEPKEKTDEEAKPDRRPRLPVLADNTSITDAVLTYNNPDRQQPFNFSATAIDESIDDEGYVLLTLSGDLNETPVSLEVSAGNTADLVEFMNVNINMKGNLGEIALDGEAQVADLLHPSRPMVRLNIDGPNVEYLTDRLRLERITTGPLSLEISTAPTSTGQQLSVHGDVGEFSIIANGQYEDLRHLDQFELNVSASGPDASTITGILGVQDVPQDPFSIVGKLSRSGPLVSVEKVTITVGQSQFDLKANFENFPNPNGANVNVRLNGPDIGRFTKLFGMPGKLGGPFDLEADLEPLAGGGAKLDMTARTNGLILTVDGDIVDADKLVGTNVHVRYEGPTLRTVTDVLNIDTAPAEPFVVDVVIERTAGGMVIDDGSMTIGDDRLSFTGTVGNKPLESGTDIKFELAGPNLADLLDSFGRDADELPHEQYHLTGRIERVPEYFVLHDVIAAIGDNVAYELSADGTITDQPRLLGSRIRLGTRGESIGAITDAAGLEGIPDVPFDVAATVTFVDNGYSIERGRVKIGDDSATINGLVGFEPLSRDTNLDFEISSPQLKDTLGGFGIDVSQIPAGELAASGAIRSEGEGFALQNIVANFAGATASVSGRLGGLPTLHGTSIRIEIGGSELSSVLPPIDAVKGLNKPFNIAADVGLSDGTLEVNSARIRVGQTRFNVDLVVGIDPMLGHGRFRISGDSPDMLPLSPQIADISMLEKAPLDLQAAGNWTDSLWTVEQFDLNLGKGRLVIVGSIDGPPSFDRTDLTFDWQISTLRNLTVLAGRDLPDIPAHLKFHLAGNDNVMSVDEIDAVIGRSDINGSFSMQSGDVPAIAVNVSSDHLNLTPFLPPPPEQPTGTDPADPPVAEVRDKNRKIISDTPVPVEFLHRLLVNLNVNFAEIQAGERVLNDVVLVGTLVDGVMTVTDFGLKTTRGGELTGKAFMVAKDNGAEIAMRVQGSDIGIGLPAYSKEELAALPRYDLDVGFITEGSTVREMASVVNGYIRLVSGPGKIRPGAMQAFTNDFLFQLLNTLNPFASQDPYSNLKCTTLLVTVEDGQVTGKPALVIQSDRLNIFANTEIDLKTEAIDVNFNTVPQKGLGLSLSNLVNPYVKVSGSLGNPILSLDPESALIQGGAAVATAGLSIIAIGLKDRFFSSKDPCGKAVSAADADFQALREKYGRPVSEARQ